MMPEIKFKHIISCSSEDKVHKAENLLKPELYRKWKCATPGEKNSTVILQFDKASEIYSVDIGNGSSAFVEVLVGKSSDATNNYQVLLSASSFMSPLESRNDIKNNRVRMFGPDKLAQNLKNEKWDCVKIVCTQPFNKNIQYGLTFIKFHSPPEPHQSSAEGELKESSLKMGAFKLKDDDNGNNELFVGSWFLKRNENSSVPPANSVAAMRKASSLAATALTSVDKPASEIVSKTQVQVPNQKRKYATDPCNNFSPNSQRQFTVTHVDKDKIEVKKMRFVSPDKPVSSKTISANNKSLEKTRPPKVKPFNSIMEKVVFVLSGFQNPFRSELRDKALDMGAKYKGDWDSSCTHLVCAFLNTPKYSQVLQLKGRIVTKEWIIESHKKKKLLPWRKYMLGKYFKETTTEEDESEEEVVQTNIKKETRNENKALLRDATLVETTKELAETECEIKDNSEANGAVESCLADDNSSVADSEEEDYQADTEADSSSGGDTEDEIRKVVEQQAKQTKQYSNKNSENSKKVKVRKTLFGNDGSSDERKDQLDAVVKPNTKDLPLPELPEFFKGKHFFLYGDFSAEERHKLRRYIIGYNGSIEEYMGDSVKFVITKEKWDKNFDEALSENDNLIFVRPEWIFKCDQNSSFVPYQPYIVVPDL